MAEERMTRDEAEALVEGLLWYDWAINAEFPPEEIKADWEKAYKDREDFYEEIVKRLMK